MKWSFVEDSGGVSRNVLHEPRQDHVQLRLPARASTGLGVEAVREFTAFI